MLKEKKHVMRKILGLDLGTNSIGWALVDEAENKEETSSIIKLGVRVNPLTVDEMQDFEKGKSITTNAVRTLKRSMRRNLQRYKLRRDALIRLLKENGFITDETILSEQGNRTTFETYRLRAKAAEEEISLEELARVLLMINKKRGYKSGRKVKGDEEGALIDGMEVAKKLYDENLTPGQLCLQLLELGKKAFPDFYRSDLQDEFDRIWEFQKQFNPESFCDGAKEEVRGKNRSQTWAILAKYFVFEDFITTIALTGLVYGVANGLVYKNGYNTGGSDIIMLIMVKYLHMPEGRATFISNLVIIAFGGIVLGVNKVVYAIIIIYVSSLIVDRMLIGISKSKLFIIHTTKEKKVLDVIVKQLHLGVTVLEAKGGYSNKEQNMLMCVVPTKNYYMFKEIILAIDKDAFFIINDCYDTAGGTTKAASVSLDNLV